MTTDCPHPVNARLRKFYNIGVFQRCPSCRLKDQFTIIHKCQAALGKRGGIFESKHRDSNLIIHKGLLKEFRRAKIALARELEHLDRLFEENQGEEQEQQVVMKEVLHALWVWQEERDKILEIPGLALAEAQPEMGNEQNKGSSNDRAADAMQTGDSQDGDDEGKPDLLWPDDNYFSVLAKHPPSSPARPAAPRPARRLRFSQTVTVLPNPFSPSDKPRKQPHNHRTDAMYANRRRSLMRPYPLSDPSPSLANTWRSRYPYMKIDTSWFRKSFVDLESDASEEVDGGEIEAGTGKIEGASASEKKIRRRGEKVGRQQDRIANR
ncbi:hypothetical protein BU23DRAFT_177483 [Bimuria novae-zelandiae CBS 107.79]|uniref:Uncharacterized protein n=1 Tax=Bimuria novae-zelandiae CBS 107.79 TaxID=1447943 RepID=A0A6A5V2E0_9PLEO|nr:hypothetical protein BU23DRAFT_177483 [Bimuria novae-zelandiae CBS 107.79]